MRNERLIYANVLTFEHDIRRRLRRRIALARASRWLLVATAVVASLYYVCVGVIGR